MECSPRALGVRFVLAMSAPVWGLTESGQGWAKKDDTRSGRHVYLGRGMTRRATARSTWCREKNPQDGALARLAVVLDATYRGPISVI